MANTKKTAPAEATETDAAASVEVVAGQADGAEATPAVDAAPVDAAVTEAAAEEPELQLVEDAIDAEADGAAVVISDPDGGENAPVVETSKGSPALGPIEENPVQPVHLPSLLRIWIGQIDSRNNDWQRDALLEDLRAAGMEMPFYIRRSEEAEISLGGVTVTSQLGAEFLLNYWAAQARQALLGRAA